MTDLSFIRINFVIYRWRNLIFFLLNRNFPSQRRKSLKRQQRWVISAQKTVSYTRVLQVDSKNSLIDGHYCSLSIQISFIFDEKIVNFGTNCTIKMKFWSSFFYSLARIHHLLTPRNSQINKANNKRCSKILSELHS